MKSESDKYTKEDLKDTIDKSEKILNKLKSVPESLTKFTNQIKLLVELLKDYGSGSYKEIPWNTIASIIFCLGYFFMPFDLVPDFIPILGFLDDAKVAAMTIKLIQKDLKKYCLYKKYDFKKYF